MQTFEERVQAEMDADPEYTREDAEYSVHEDDVMEAHYAEIKRVYGKKRADNANIGWGTSEGSIASKVYGDPAMVVVTTWDEETGEILGHEHRPY